MTKDELVFVKRMAFHVERGLSFDDAARAVIDDDQRIFAAFCDRGHSNYVSTFDERGKAHYTGERTGDVIVRQLSIETYEKVRA